jgi:DNA-binding CsgD family transcriptional regulator
MHTLTSDHLITAGIIEEIPQGYNVDQFCMALSTQILGGAADLGTTLLRVNTRGQWEMLGGFLELFDLGEKLHQQRSAMFPTLMEALREGHATTTFDSESCSNLGLDLSGHLFVAGLTRRGFGVLILGSSQPLNFSATAVKLLVAVTELLLGRSEYSTVQTAGIPQVNGDNSSIIFTERQMQVLELLADGKTNTEIGRKLSISASLAKQEVAFLSHALQAKNRLDVVLQAQRQGVLPVAKPQVAP